MSASGRGGAPNGTQRGAGPDTSGSPGRLVVGPRGRAYSRAVTVSPAASPGASPRGGARTGRAPRTGPGQRTLLWGSLLVGVGSFLPWVDTVFGSVTGVRGAGLWTFYAAFLGLAGALVPLRRLAAVQAAVLAVAALGLPAWQVVHLLSLVGVQGWRPGTGLVLVVAGGVLAARAALALSRPQGATPGGGRRAR